MMKKASLTGKRYSSLGRIARHVAKILQLVPVVVEGGKDIASKTFSAVVVVSIDSTAKYMSYVQYLYILTYEDAGSASPAPGLPGRLLLPAALLGADGRGDGGGVAGGRLRRRRRRVALGGHGRRAGSRGSGGLLVLI